jgi:peptidoglycan DL-endopeptidase CwlO
MIRSRARSRRLVPAAAAGVFACLAILCGALILATGPAPAKAAIPSDLQSVRLFGDVRTQIDDLEIQAGYVQAEIEALDVQLEQYSEAYNQVQVRLDELNVEMAGLRRKLGAAESDHAYRVKKLEDRVCSLYKAGGKGDELLELLVSANGIEDLINRIRVASTLADQDQRIVDNLIDSADRLDSVLAQIDKTKREQLSLRRQAGDQREQIRAALAERESTLEGLGADIRAIIEAEAARQREEQERLQKALVALLNGGQIYEGPLPETDAEILNQFLETAAYYMGIPYVWAGDRPSTGFDCSGFTQYVYAQHGIGLPHYSGFQAQMGIPVAYEEMKPGDLVAFGYPVHHVGIYVGDGMFIHAPRTGDVIKVSYLSEKNDLSAIRRFELQPRIGAPTVW